MNRISQNIQEILAVDPTTQGNDGTDMAELHAHRNSPSSWEKRKLGLVGENHLH